MPKARAGMSCFALLLLLLAGTMSAQESGEQGEELRQTVDELTPAQAQADFDILRKALEEAHGGLYRFVAKPELDRRFDACRARLNRPVTRRELIGLFSEMLAGIRDGHTRLEYDEATAADLAKARLFPLRVLIEGSRIMVVFNDTPADSTIVPGMEILSINGRKASELLALLLPRLSGDGFIETGKRTRLGRSFAQSYWLFVDQAAEFTVTARDAAGKAVTARLPGVLTADRDQNNNPVNARIKEKRDLLEGPKENVSLSFAADPDIARLRIRSFGGEDYPALLETTFRTLRDKGTRALALDLRGNGGGVDEYGALLVSYFTDKPFRYFERIRLTTIRPSFATWQPGTFEDLRGGVVPDPAGGYLATPKLHQGVAEQSPAAHPFLGKVFVLLDGGTFSTAADVAALLKHLKRATFVGEESAGTYEGNTSGLNALITLPNSKLRLKVQMYGYWNAVSGGEKGRGTLPDHPVEKRVADLLRGVDAPWEKALALARAALGTENPGTETDAPVHGEIPKRLDPGTRYVIYLHGRIIEDQGPRPTHETWGVYEYRQILDTLAAAGFTVISEQRRSGTDMDQFAEKVAQQVRTLIQQGVPAEHITVIGFSKGGGIATRASGLLKNDKVNFVFLAACGDGNFSGSKLDVRGRILSIYEASDDAGRSCAQLFARSKGTGERKEIEIETGGGHGAFYQPRPEWVDPTIAWIRQKPRVNESPGAK